MTIIITAMEATAPIEGMISVSFGKPPISRLEATDLKSAIEFVNLEHTRLVAAGINHQVFATCYGEKPRGWNQARQLLRKDFIA